MESISLFLDHLSRKEVEQLIRMSYQQVYDRLPKHVKADIETGLIAYTSGVAKADDGAARLADGCSKLNDSMPALKEGVGTLKDGTKTLSEGIHTFDTEGISKLTGLKQDKLDKVADRLDVLRNISKDCTEKKVIYRLDGIQ